jgi:hypothetical protein
VFLFGINRFVHLLDIIAQIEDYQGSKQVDPDLLLYHLSHTMLIASEDSLNSGLG